MIEDKIKNKLDDYLEFDSKLLFNRTPILCKYEYGGKVKRLVRIFGGAIRDIIADQTINDIDILVGAQSLKLIELTLKENGYTYIEMLNGKYLQEMYSEIHIINEPHTWIKGTKIVQLIRPVVFNQESSKYTDKSLSIYEQGFKDLISNVDFSCCGVSWDGETLHEDYPNAILHAQSKVFSVNMWAKMYSPKRAQHRKVKLENRGWKEIENKTEVNRDLKLNLFDI
jgi:hypothetical protein